jgi:uncharacterized membrane protein YagU involved in acid resistance
VNCGTNKKPHKHTSDSGLNWMASVMHPIFSLVMGCLVIVAPKFLAKFFPTF